MENKSLFFSKFSSFATIATFFALWFAVYFDSFTEEILGYLIILSVGIIHGSNDIKLLSKSVEFTKGRSFLQLLLPYVLVVLTTAAAFYFFPFAAILIFVLISGYHFGEQHMTAKIKAVNFISGLFILAYGLLIFSLLFHLTYEETSSIIADISGVSLSESVFYWALIMTSGITLISGLILFLRDELKVNLFEELILILVFFILFGTASLIWGFAIYFVLWHSVPSLIDQVKQLYGAINKKNMVRFLTSSLIYWFLAIIGLGTMFYVLRNDEKLFLSLFFSFLAAITFPHVIVIYLFFKR